MIRAAAWYALLLCIVLMALEIAGTLWALPFCVVVIGLVALMWRVA